MHHRHATPLYSRGRRKSGVNGWLHGAFFASCGADSTVRRNRVEVRGRRAYSTSIDITPTRRNVMNALKHMEAAFVIALSVAGIGGYLAASAQDAYALPAPISATAAPDMAVVTVVGKRLSAAEKAQSLREESVQTAAR
jgi:hypothetical protein